MPMFRVNNMSKSKAGSGTSIITRMSNTKTGTAAWAEGFKYSANLDRKVFIYGS
jgi:hypothetical protein